jgi:hypothetical protein
MKKIITKKRPEMDINYAENGHNKFLGKVKNPCYCCNMGVHVFTSEERIKYKIEGT